MRQSDLVKERGRGGRTGSAAGDTTTATGHKRILQSHVGTCACSADGRG